MGSVTIGGNSYQIYGDETGANQYWAAGLGPAFDKWSTATQAKRDNALVSATRVLDGAAWQGTPVSTPILDVVLAWPRVSVTVDDQPVTGIPDGIIKGTYELAGQLLVNSGLLTQATSGSNIKRIGGSGVPEVEFFVPTLGITGEFPTSVTRYVGPYLAGTGGSLSGSYSVGTDGSQTSQFGTDSGDLGFGLNKVV